MKLRGWLLVTMLLLQFGGTATAQQATSGDVETAPPRRSALGVRQQRVQRMMEDLQRKFTSLAQSLQQSDPQRAQRLIDALQQSKRLLIEARMGQITELLDGARLDTATAQQQQILADLRQLIELLLDEESQLDERLEELQRLQQWKEQIGRLLDEERPQLHESQQLAGTDKTLPPDAFQQFARRQDETADRTARLAEQLTSPGQDQVQQAGQAMRDASRNLRKQDPAGAALRQDEAIKRLEEALGEIEERLNRLREETQVERLARLQDRFREMLARQQEITLSTSALDVKRIDGSLRRGDRLQLAKQATRQRELTELASAVLETILKDGTSVVFAKVVEGLRDDLQRAADLLAAARTDSYTQRLQMEIENTLQELIDALERVQSSLKATGGGGGGGDDQPTLLPSSAELQLLRAAQLRVNRLTEAFDRARPDGRLDELSRTELQHIASRQLDIAIMTKQIMERN